MLEFNQCYINVLIGGEKLCLHTMKIMKNLNIIFFSFGNKNEQRKSDNEIRACVIRINE